MARSPIEIGIASETKAFRQGVESGIIKPLEDAERALDEFGRARGPEALERELKDAERQTERLADETKKTARTIEREFKDSYGKAGDSAKRGMRESGEAAAEFKQEALANLSEVTSSFDGSMDSITDLVQGTLGGIAGSIPGIGLLGAAAAVGVGAIAGAFASGDDASQESKQRAAEWAQAWIDSGGLVISATTKAASALDIITDPARYDEATRKATEWGVDVPVAIAAMTGETWALQAAQDSLTTTAQRVADEMREVGIQDQEVADNLVTLQTNTANGERSLEALRRELAGGKAQAGDYSSYLRLMAENTAEATTRTDEFGDRIVTLPDGKTIYIDAQTGAATDSADAIEQRIYSLPDKTVHVDANTDDAHSGVDAVNRRGVDDKTVRIGVDDSAVRNYRPLPLPELVQRIRPQVIQNDVRFIP